MDTAAEFRKTPPIAIKWRRYRTILKLKPLGDGWPKDGFYAPNWRKRRTNH
jgi:hypothetical protein